MKQVYTHKQLLEFRHECQITEVKQFAFGIKNPFSSLHSTKLKNNIWASYPVAANHNAKVPLSPKHRPDRGRRVERGKLENIPPIFSAPIGILDLPVGAKIIKAARGAPIPMNAIRVSFEGNFTDENAVHDAVRFRDPEVRRDQYKYGFDEVFWELPDVEHEPQYTETQENREQMPEAPSSRATMYGYHYAPFFEQYIRKSVLRGREEDAPEDCSVYDTESVGDSSDSSNVQIQLPDLRA